MTEARSEFLLPIDVDENDALVPTVEADIPPHVELELVEKTVEDLEDEFVADANARLNGDMMTTDTPDPIAKSLDALPVYTPPERTDLEKEIARDTIRSIGQAIGRERSRKKEKSIMARRLRY